MIPCKTGQRDDFCYRRSRDVTRGNAERDCKYGHLDIHLILRVCFVALVVFFLDVVFRLQPIVQVATVNSATFEVNIGTIEIAPWPVALLTRAAKQHSRRISETVSY